VNSSIKNTFPESWVNVTLKDVGTSVTGNTPSTKDKSNYGAHLPYIKPPQLNNCLIRKSDEYLSAKGAALARILPAFSVLVSCIGNLGRTALNTAPVAFNQQINAVIPYEGLNPKFLFYQAQSHYVRSQLEEKSTATTISIVNKGNFEKVNLNLAPINEQHRIVAKIETLFAELDKGIESLKTAREQLKVYRQAVLKHAFEGKLTAQWREQNKDKLETPQQLLASIQQERQARYQQQLKDWQADVKVWETNDKEGKKPGRPRLINAPKINTERDFEVPAEWELMELGTLAFESILGKMLDKAKNIGLARPYLGNINVRWGAFNLDNLKSMKIEESEVERYSLESGDIVICEGGEPGRCAVWQNTGTPVFIQKALHRVRFTESYSSRFAFYYLTYSTPLERVIKHFTGTTIKHLTGTGLNKVQFPVCSLEEQLEIVNILEEKLSLIESLESEIYRQLKKSETLRQSILKKAFSGKLVPQDPNDEPASALLARIEAENATHAVNSRKTINKETGETTKQGS